MKYTSRQSWAWLFSSFLGQKQGFTGEPGTVSSLLHDAISNESIKPQTHKQRNQTECSLQLSELKTDQAAFDSCFKF